MISINTDRQKVFELLNQLKPDTPPVFGKMTPQHMVEHLAFVVKISFAANAQLLKVSEETALKSKNFVINTDKELPTGIKFPGIGENLLPMVHKNIKEAIEDLKDSLNGFENYFSENREVKTTHPVLGPLNYEEWVIFHNKHFSHHFKQFNLLD